MLHINRSAWYTKIRDAIKNAGILYLIHLSDMSDSQMFFNDYLA